MPAKSIHKAHIEEHIQGIENAIVIGIEKRPATMGLHISACSIDLVELYLHVLGKISVGMLIKHEWFKRPKEGQKIAPLAERKLGVVFPHKEKIIGLLYTIEEHRNSLIYGKPKKAALDAVLSSFQELYQIIKEELTLRGEEIA